MLKTCERNSEPSAEANAVVATSDSTDVTAVAHTNRGMRVNVMPGARILTTVVRKLRPVSVAPMPIVKMATVQKTMPTPACSDTGGYSVQPASGAPKARLESRMSMAGGAVQKLTMFSHGKATSRAPI